MLTSALSDTILLVYLKHWKIPISIKITYCFFMVKKNSSPSKTIIYRWREKTTLRKSLYPENIKEQTIHYFTMEQKYQSDESPLSGGDSHLKGRTKRKMYADSGQFDTIYVLTSIKFTSLVTVQFLLRKKLPTIERCTRISKKRRNYVDLLQFYCSSISLLPQLPIHLLL